MLFVSRHCYSPIESQKEKNNNVRCIADEDRGETSAYFVYVWQIQVDLENNWRVDIRWRSVELTDSLFISTVHRPLSLVIQSNSLMRSCSIYLISIRIWQVRVLCSYVNIIPSLSESASVHRPSLSLSLSMGTSISTNARLSLMISRRSSRTIRWTISRFIHVHEQIHPCRWMKKNLEMEIVVLFSLSLSLSGGAGWRRWPY